jgi:hypothetical protein
VSQITIDHQNAEQKCDHCGETFEVTRGSAYDEGDEGFSIYLAGLHACDSGKLAHMAIAIREGYEGFEDTCAVCLHVWVDESEFRMSVIDPDQSPWKNEAYLGRIMDREEALEHHFISTFFHIADHIVSENPQMKEYFND